MRKKQEIKDMILDLKREMREIQANGDLTYRRKLEYNAQIHALNWVLERGIYE